MHLIEWYETMATAASSTPLNTFSQTFSILRGTLNEEIDLFLLFVLCMEWWDGEWITTAAIKKSSMLLYILRLQIVQFGPLFVSQTTQNSNQCERINTMHPHPSHIRHRHLPNFHHVAKTIFNKTEICAHSHSEWNADSLLERMKKKYYTNRIGQVQEKVYNFFARKYFSIHISARVFFCCCDPLLDVNLFLLLHRTITLITSLKNMLLGAYRLRVFVVWMNVSDYTCSFMHEYWVFNNQSTEKC